MSHPAAPRWAHVDDPDHGEVAWWMTAAPDRRGDGLKVVGYLAAMARAGAGNDHPEWGWRDTSTIALHAFGERPEAHQRATDTLTRLLADDVVQAQEDGRWRIAPQAAAHHDAAIADRPQLPRID